MPPLCEPEHVNLKEVVLAGILPSCHLGAHPAAREENVKACGAGVVVVVVVVVVVGSAVVVVVVGAAVVVVVVVVVGSAVVVVVVGAAVVVVVPPHVVAAKDPLLQPDSGGVDVGVPLQNWYAVGGPIPFILSFLISHMPNISNVVLYI